MPSNDVTLEVFYDGAWHDLVTSDQVLADQAITITRGDGAESAAFRPASLIASLDNTDDVYRPSNPESPLYGLVGRNTPLRVSVDGTPRGEFEISSWKPDQTRDFRRSPKRGKAWTDIEAGGLLARINAWKDPLRSTAYTYYSSVADVVGYWPMEERRTATALTVTTPGASTTTLRGFSFESDAFPPGSAPLMQLSGAAAGNFRTGGASDNAGWQVGITALTKVMAPAGVEYTLMSWRTADNTLHALGLYDSDKVRLSVDNGTGLVIDLQVAPGSIPVSQFITFVVRSTVSGGTVTVSLSWLIDAEEGFVDLGSGTFAGTTSSLTRWTISVPTTEDITVGHLIGTSGTATDLRSGDAVNGLRGHPNERTAYRFARLCELKGIPYFIRGDVNAGTQMGPQGVASLAEQFREIRDTEDGIIFDDVGGRYVIFTVRDGRFNQSVCSIDVTDLPAPPAEVTDDLGLHNLVTVQNVTDGEATAEDTTSAMGTQPTPDGVGVYDFTVDVNVNDRALLPQHANWWLRRGTVDLPRYPKVTVNMAVLSPEKRSEVEDLDVGDVLEITGYRENTIRLFVIGYVEKIPNAGARSITFTCAPDQQFHVGAYAPSDTQRRYDMRTATVKTAAGQSDTTLTLKCTDDEAWSNTSTYDVMIAGERVTFTAGQVGARTGTAGDYQQIVTNVVRSVNGVRKALPAGSAAHVAEQGRWAL